MTSPRPIPTVGDRAFAVDAVAILAISVAIAVAADRLVFMSVLVPAVVGARLALWAALDRDERGTGIAAELALFALCTVVGAFNDWSSVVRHGIYDYSVPVYRPDLTTIPLWMLLYWGLILRFVATLARWRRLRPPAHPDDRVWIGARPVVSRWLRIALLLAIVATTRQLVYRLFDDPLWSWLPFALALVVYAVALRPDRLGRRLALVFAIGGPLVEIVYIQLGGLHRYHLGWIGGVPLWICLWWVLAALIWRELAARIQLAMPPWSARRARELDVNTSSRRRRPARAAAR